MDTPGFKNENIDKPDITKAIEGASSVVSQNDAAKAMLAGVLNRRYYISNDLLGTKIDLSR